jgi:hypothetical protein
MKQCRAWPSGKISCRTPKYEVCPLYKYTVPDLGHGPQIGVRLQRISTLLAKIERKWDSKEIINMRKIKAISRRVLNTK